MSNFYFSFFAEMKMERLTAEDWPWVQRWLLEHLDSIGGGLEAGEVPVLKWLLDDRENWLIRGEHRGVTGLFVFVRKGHRNYEVHASGSGPGWAWIALSRRVLRWFVSKSHAERVGTFVHAEDARNVCYVRACGMRRGRTERRVIGRLGERLVRWFRWMGKESV